jgi:2-polyprenyl-3-methyl-5-hydroxy-6-metoxy-1,4-benzoquinol methylase
VTGSTTDIPTVERPSCPACGSPGVALYEDMHDALFGSPGAWNVKRCVVRRCGTLWLDPAPAAQAIASLYADYYTHAEPIDLDSTRRPGNPFRRAYWARRFHYPYRESVLARLYALAFSAAPERSAALANDVYHLDHRPGGSALEVGCGTGEMVAALARHGWRAQGVDFDSRAIAGAQQAGLDVRQGDVASLPFADASFDAVVSRHVVEHLPDADVYWATARRLLKPGGTLVVVTPNAGSLGHRLFGRHWRGLETPRHLCVYSTRSLASAVVKAGFDLRSARTSILGTRQLFRESNRIRAAFGRGPLRFPPTLAVWLEWAADRIGWRLGEETVLIATRPR